jgi:hypothetical protein
MNSDIFEVLGYKRNQKGSPMKKKEKAGRTWDKPMTDEEVHAFLFGEEKSSALEVTSSKIYEKHVIFCDLNDKTYTLKAKVSPDHITLIPHARGYDTFKFDRSHPDTIRAVAHLMVAACDLGEE